MRYITEAQLLANKYRTAIKSIRLICKVGITPVIVPDDKPVSTITVQNVTTYQQDFNEFTERYRDTIKEVRVIFKGGAGASQFFPRGTSEKVVWESVIPKEEMA